MIPMAGNFYCSAAMMNWDNSTVARDALNSRQRPLEAVVISYYSYLLFGCPGPFSWTPILNCTIWIPDRSSILCIYCRTTHSGEAKEALEISLIFLYRSVWTIWFFESKCIQISILFSISNKMMLHVSGTSLFEIIL